MLQETLEFVQHLSDYVDGVTNKPPTPSLKKGVLVDIRLTREIEKWYEHERDYNTMTVNNSFSRVAWCTAIRMKTSLICM